MRPLVKVLIACISFSHSAYAHDISEHSHGSHAVPSNAKSSPILAPEQAAPFNHFAPLVQTRFDDNYLYIESNSIPNHPMMIGITAWQQQVPLPQPYNGSNAWRIPLHPVVAKNPLSAKDNFFRGAIALAANGVPIFNPIKNDGKTETLLAGELDNWGGHSGRGDDYHYHVAPLHLQETLGNAHPVAYALDGYPIYGYTEPDGSPAGKLDAFNGHIGPKDDYHYHATRKYPYLNGGFHGEVENRDGQVSPQPQAGGVRPYTRPLRGATITDWAHPDENTFSLKYKLSGKTSTVTYTLLDQGRVRFDFIDPKGNTTSETYSPEDRKGSQNRNGGEKRSGNRDQKRSKGDRPDSRADANERPRKGPDPNDPNRKPWIEAHAAEIDADKDGAVSRPELIAEIARTLQTMDTNADDSISQEESEARGNRLPMAGFVKGHFDELDKNSDATISSKELSDSFLRMYDRQGQKKPRK
jgi:hypothetical protein